MYIIHLEHSTTALNTIDLLEGYTFFAEHLRELIGQDRAISIIKAQTQKFPDGEISVKIPNNSLDACDKFLIVHELFPNPNERWVELFLLISQLRNIATEINLFAPYLSYARTDLAVRLWLDLLVQQKVRRIITFDFHNPQMLDHAGFPSDFIINLSCAQDFAKILQKNFQRDFEHALIVSPDYGGINRANLFAQALNSQQPIIYCKKIRQTMHSSPRLKLELESPPEIIADRNCIIVDDIIDSGSTISAAASLLYAHGAREVGICVTHALMQINDLISWSRQNNLKFLLTSNSVLRTDEAKLENPTAHNFRIIDLKL